MDDQNGNNQTKVPDWDERAKVWSKKADGLMKSKEFRSFCILLILIILPTVLAVFFRKSVQPIHIVLVAAGIAAIIWKRARICFGLLAAIGSTFFLVQRGFQSVIATPALSNSQAGVLAAMAIGWVIVICYAISLLGGGRDD